MEGDLGLGSQNCWDPKLSLCFFSSNKFDKFRKLGLFSLFFWVFLLLFLVLVLWSPVLDALISQTMVSGCTACWSLEHSSNCDRRSPHQGLGSPEQVPMPSWTRSLVDGILLCVDVWTTALFSSLGFPHLPLLSGWPQCVFQDVLWLLTVTQPSPTYSLHPAPYI